jgi:hypothetical protein
MDTPKATLEIAGKSSDAIAAGVIAPKLDRLELNNTESKYGTNQVGAIIYVKDVSVGAATGKEVKVTTTGYYYFDGSLWQPLIDNVTVDRITGGTKGEVLTADASGNVLWAPFVAGKFSIGLDSAAARAALLDVKSVQSAVGAVSSVTDAANVTSTDGGLLLPRVQLVNDSTLEPFIAKTDAQWTANTNALKERHAGLMVYNLTEDENENFSPGIYYWDGEKWCAIQKGAQKAIFDVDCSSVEVRGSYGNGVSLDGSNYLKLNVVNVTRAGSYSITATASPDNGYFFEQVGNFYSEGSFALTIPGTGQPIDHQIDNFTLTISGGSGTCTFTIPVKDMTIPRNFTMDCSKTVVNGMYFEDEQIGSDPAHGPQTISVTINVQAASVGSTVEMQTNEVDGISFSGSALVTTTPTQVVTLQGTGTPRELKDKVFTITCNSAISTASCSATLHMLIPRKRLLAIGMSSAYGYNPGDVGSRNPRNDLNALLTDENNFGYNQWSILRFAGFKNRTGENWVTGANSWTDDDRDIIAMTGAVWNAMSPSRLERLLKGSDGKPKIDIVMIGHDAAYCNATTGDAVSRADLLTDFVKNGGILMICSEITASNQNFLRRFFGDNTIAGAGGAGAGSRYTLAFNTTNMPPEMKPYYCKDDDPILAGPFENIVGREWGEDASITTYIANLPLDEIIIYSGAREIGNTSRSAEGVTIFRHRDYPFVFVGDGGFNSGEIRTYTGSTVCPFRLTSKVINGHTYNNYPTYRPNYGSSSGRAYNAVFSANAFAWCIEKAEEWRRAHK